MPPDDIFDPATASASIGFIGPWKEWAVYLLKAVKNHDDRLDALRREAAAASGAIASNMSSCRKDKEETIQQLRDAIALQNTEIALLKLKAGVWGLIGGCIPVATGLLIFLVQKVIN